MIVVDTSALFAIVAHESEGEAFVEVLDRADQAQCSAVTFVEAVMVLTGRSHAVARGQVEELLEAFAIVVEPVDSSQVDVAVEAFGKFGKGRHRASLNLADCFAYALAKSKNAPLLYKGNDFSQTDIGAAWQQ